MFSVGDFKEKSVLIINCVEYGMVGLKFRNDNLIYEKAGGIVSRFSCHKLFVIFIIGDCTLTTCFIHKATRLGIFIFLLRRNLEVYASFSPLAEGNFLLRQKQYGLKSDLSIAKNIVRNKIANQSSLIKKAVHGFQKDTYLKNVFEKIDNATDDKELLGIEGTASKTFFDSYFGGIGWYKRLPRTKVDIYNLLLDIGYSLLFNYIDAILRVFGFDTYKGVYHKLFFKRKSLSCDIVEPFRCIIDYSLLKAFNLKVINPKDFKFINGKFFLSFDKSVKYTSWFLQEILKHKDEIFIYIRDYYHYFMKVGAKDDKDFPYFKI